MPQQLRVWFAVAFACLMVVVWLRVRGRNTIPPRALVKVHQQSLGQLPVENSAKLIFPISNTGGRDLHILGIESSCGCLATSFPTTIRSGRKAQILLDFQPMPDWSGPVRKSVLVRTNDPQSPAIELEVHADIVPLLHITPTQFIHIPGRRGAIQHRRLHLAPREGVDVAVTQAVSNHPFIRAKLSAAPRTVPVKEYYLDLTIGPYDWIGGEQQGSIDIKTSHPKIPTKTITVTASISEGIAVEPPNVTLPMTAPGQTDEELTAIRISAPDEEAFEITAVESNVPGLVARAKTGTPKREHQLRLVRTQPLSSGRLQGTVQVYTTAGDRIAVSIPVDVTVR
ncbi:MAG: DUF1573 domain-containing protein [Actinomycetota bacterium]